MSMQTKMEEEWELEKQPTYLFRRREESEIKYRTNNTQE